jgi:6-phosphogluconolactonase (cycloisomerase 2 family)
VYANSTSGNASAIAAFQIDPNTGVLTAVAGSPFSTGGNGASFVRIDASGKFLYVANSITNTIQGFAIDQTTGALTAVPGSPLATDTTPLVTLDPSGRYLYSTNSGANTIASYSINTTTGALTLVTRIATGTKPVAVEIVGRQ